MSGIKVSDPDTGLFYPENVVCAFVFAADHGVEITNNSYYVDPWLYNCLDDPDQKAIVDAVNRAQLYAQKKGTLNLASAGNSNHDLDSDAIVDASSPNDTTPYERTIDRTRASTYPPAPGRRHGERDGREQAQVVLLDVRQGCRRHRRAGR